MPELQDTIMHIDFKIYVDNTQVRILSLFDSVQCSGESEEYCDFERNATLIFILQATQDLDLYLLLSVRVPFKLTNDLGRVSSNHMVRRYVLGKCQIRQHKERSATNLGDNTSRTNRGTSTDCDTRKNSHITRDPTIFTYSDCTAQFWPICAITELRIQRMRTGEE